MAWTTTEPSPTAEATRFTEPLRTSPTAKTPGRLVRNGDSAAPAMSDLSPEVFKAAPVRTNPFSSSATVLRSHPVHGSAPIITKRPQTPRFRVSSVERLIIVTPSSVSPPRTSVTSVRNSIMTFRVLSKRVIRYCDMVWAKSDPRQSR